jgi:dTDP-4-dehydrorhamnose reductase
MKRLLVTGAGGFLGSNLCRHADRRWDIWGTYLSHPAPLPRSRRVHIDLTRFKDLNALIATVDPDAVIHAAAASKPDFCQKNPTLSYKINAEASCHIAGLCADRHIPCIFTSTDLIFDGRNPPYSETDPPSPVNIYAEHKLKAEIGMKQRNPETIICRMALMFGASYTASKSVLQPMLEAMRAGRRLPLFVDEFRTPLSGRDAVAGIMLALEKRPDLLHLAGSESISRLEFGRRVKAAFNIKQASLAPCLQKSLDLAAPRPPDISLDISKAVSLGFLPHSMTEALKDLAENSSG